MVTITSEQKQALQNATTDFVKFKILEDYINSLFTLGFRIVDIQRLIEREADINVKYANLLNYVKHHIKNKKLVKKEQVTSTAGSALSKLEQLKNIAKGGN